MNNDMALTPADVREFAAEIIRSLDLIARNYDSYEYGLPVMTHYDEMVDTVAALLRTPRGEGERVQEPTQEQIDDACMWYRHDFGLLSEKERDSVRFEARQWFRAWGKALSNETTTRAPADVREQVAMEVYVWEHVRRGAEESWARQRWQTETDGMRDLYFETADRILALLRTPRGGGRSALWWAANELVAALEGRSTLTVQQCITGVKRLLAEADLRTPRGEQVEHSRGRSL